MATGVTLNKDSSANIRLEWQAYSQGTNPASGLILFWRSMEGVSISGATKADPCVITATSHGLNTGDKIRISEIVGMTELNDLDYTITKIDADSFSLDGINSTGYTTYTSGGIITPGELQTSDASKKLSVDSTFYVFEGLAADLYYRFGLAAYKTTLAGMAVGNIKDHANWKKVQPTTTPNYTGNISNEAAADIKNKVQGMNTSGDYIGKGTGNQRIVIDYANGRMYFYNSSNAEIIKFGENVVFSYDGIDLGNLGVIAGGGNSRSGNQSPIYLSASTNHATNVLNQVIFIENVQSHASNSATIRGMKGVATHLGTGTAIGIYGEASSTGGIAWAGYFEGDVYINGKIDITGSYQMDGADIIDVDGYQTGVLKTKQPFIFGYNAEISQVGVGTNTLDALTLDGSANTQGYRMVRAGKITGVSLQFRGTAAPGDAQLKATVQKNGTNQTMNVTKAVSVSNNLGAESTANAFTVVAGDRINVELALTEVTGGTPKVEDVVIVIEFAA